MSNYKAMAAIHIAKKELQMDDETYRNMLFNLTGKRSAKGLTHVEIGKVLDHLRTLGALKTAPVHKGKPHNFDKLPEMITKIEALLADMKLPWSYADSIVKRQTGIDATAWVRDEKSLRAVIAALVVEQEKRGLLGALIEHLKERDMTIEQFEEKNSTQLKKGWKRNRRTLKALCNHFLFSGG